jgi:hypothetical protein
MDSRTSVALPHSEFLDQAHIRTICTRVDSVRGGIRTSFELVPDAPVSKFVLEMQGGKKGLLVNSRDICKRTNRAVANFDAQNGKVADFRPVLKAQCGKKPKRQKHRRHR